MLYKAIHLHFAISDWEGHVPGKDNSYFCRRLYLSLFKKHFPSTFDVAIKEEFDLIYKIIMIIFVKIITIIGSLSKHDVDGSENVI